MLRLPCPETIVLLFRKTKCAIFQYFYSINSSFCNKNPKIGKQIFSYFLCNIPMHLNYVFSLPRIFYYVSILFYSAQYAINFIIYHLSYSQYRKASCYFLKHLYFKIFCSKGENNYQYNISISKKANSSRTNTFTSISRKNQT